MNRRFAPMITGALLALTAATARAQVAIPCASVQGVAPHQPFAFVRVAMTLTLLGVLLAELYVSISGIGYFTQVFAETFDPAPLFALMTVLTIMAIVLNELVRLVEARFTRWKS